MTDDPHGVREHPGGNPSVGPSTARSSGMCGRSTRTTSWSDRTASIPISKCRSTRSSASPTGSFHVSVNRDSVTEVDDVETVHRMGEE